MYGTLRKEEEAGAGTREKPATRVHDGRIMSAAAMPSTSARAKRQQQPFASEFLKSAVYGAMDGVLTSFAVVSGGEGGSLSPNVVIVLGLSGLIANAMSMGIGDAVSTLSYDEHVQSERLREEWEFENFPEGEIREMVDLYESRGLPRDSAEIVVNTMSKYKELFLDIMVAEELGLKIAKPEDANNYWKGGLINFVSFFLFGLLPLVTYVACIDFCPASWSQGELGDIKQPLFKVSLCATLASLFLLGVLKSKFTCAVWWRSGVEFCILGGLCATVAFATGKIVSNLVESGV